ncbi:ankyrin repeat domain-containing protein [Paracoccus sp. S-4012]|uniref:ankyrin repeat domain-containing protein n=1 Tax=Paracoccus sp. S-4012 TaxID=2665648 RepID=UPI00351BD23B
MWRTRDGGWRWPRQCTPLDYALCLNSLSAATVLYELGALPDHPNTDRPALHSALIYRHLDWVKQLVARGADVNKPTPYRGNRTPLSYAASQLPESIPLLLSKGALANVTDPKGRTPLMLVAAHADVVAWDALISAGVAVTQPDHTGHSALHYASFHSVHRTQDCAEIISSCLDLGLDPNRPSENGLTPVLSAARFGGRCVEQLLDADGNPNAIDEHGQTFLIHAARSTSYSLSEALLIDDNVSATDIAGRSPIFWAALSRTDPEALERLIDAGSDFEELDALDRTPLMYILRKHENGGAETLARFFLDKLPDMYRKDHHGNGYWHHLTTRTRIRKNALAIPQDFCSELINWGKYVELGPPEESLNFPKENDAFPLAGEKTNAPSLARILLSFNGGDTGIDDRNGRSQTAFLNWCSSQDVAGSFAPSDTELVKIFVSRNVDLNTADEEGNSPLILLCQRHPFSESNLVEAVEAICLKGADVNAKNFAGETPIDLAMRGGLRLVAAALRRYGAGVPHVVIEDHVNDVELPVVESLTLPKLSDSGSVPLVAEEFQEQSTAPIVTRLEPTEGCAIAACNSEVGPWRHPIGTGGEDPKTSLLHSEASAMYRAANTAYQQDAQRQFAYIQLESGKRTIQRQVQFYRDYIEYKDCDGPKKNAANWPGKSWHNYGLAIDVIRGNDERRIKTALIDAGWEANVDGEGWHFEAKGAHSWDTIKGDIAERAEPRAKDCAFAIVEDVLYGCYIKRNEEKFREQQREISELRRELDQKRRDLDRRRRDLQSRAESLRREQAEINEEQAYIASLRREYDGMVYDLCPNNQSYNECTHIELKQRWDQQRQDLWRTCQSRATALRLRRSRLQREIMTLRGDERAWQRDKQVFQDENRDYSLKVRDYRQLEQRMNRWRRLQNERRRAVSALAAQIQTIADEIANG